MILLGHDMSHFRIQKAGIDGLEQSEAIATVQEMATRFVLTFFQHLQIIENIIFLQILYEF